jgi:hypothetical protein
MNGVRVNKLDHHDLPDPIIEVCSGLQRDIDALMQKIGELEAEIEQLKANGGIKANDPSCV